MTRRIHSGWIVGVFGWVMAAMALVAQAEDSAPAPAEDSVASDHVSEGSDEASAEEENKAPVQLRPPVLDRPILSPANMVEKALQAEGRQEEVVWIGESKPFLALELPELTGVPQGAVILLHDHDQHPDWPKVIKPLREQLPDIGWHTLSIALPYARHPEVPERVMPVKQVDVIPAALLGGETEGVPATEEAPEAETQAPTPDEGSEAAEAATDAPVDPEQAALQEAVDAGIKEAETGQVVSDGADQMAVTNIKKTAPANTEIVAPNTPEIVDTPLLRLQAALKYLNGKGFQNIVIIAYRNSAETMLAYIKEAKARLPAKGMTFVMVDARLSPEYQVDLGAILGDEFAWPFLDIADKSNDYAKHLAKQRLGSVRRQRIGSYTSLLVPVRAGDYRAPDTLVRRIQGWLKVHAPGMKAKSYEVR